MNVLSGGEKKIKIGTISKGNSVAENQSTDSHVSSILEIAPLIRLVSSFGENFPVGDISRVCRWCTGGKQENAAGGEGGVEADKGRKMLRECLELNSGSEVSEDSEPEVDETDDAVHVSARQKRDLRAVAFPSTSGCATTSGSQQIAAKKNSRPKWLPPGYRITLYKGNPVYGFRMQLYCRTGYLLAIFSDQKVRGTDEDHPNALVEFSSVDFGEVRIKGLEANLFLAMNKKGRLYGEVNGKDEATVFVEYVYGQYNLYLSRKWAHLGWYVGIKKSGKIKPGHQTRYGQKAIQFLPRRKRYW